jgi:hypothetical protein
VDLGTHTRIPHEREKERSKIMEEEKIINNLKDELIEPIGDMDEVINEEEEEVK